MNTQQQPDSKPGMYFVTAVKGSQWIPLVGPFENDHAAALAMVEPARKKAEEIDAKAVWYAYGTMRADADTPQAKLVGRLNSYFDMKGLAA